MAAVCPCRATPSHIVRCLFGSALRIAHYGSLVNLGLAAAGKTRGFWATKVVSVAVRASKKLFTSRFDLRRTLQEAKAASSEACIQCPSVLCVLCDKLVLSHVRLQQ
jgi:hypothetical protein